MKLELRKQLLEDMSRNDYGQALFEYVKEEIGKLSDITRLTQENIDANRIAVIELRRIFAFLNRLKDDNTTKSKNIYK